MPSPRTEPERSATGGWARFDPRGPGAIFQRLNIRLVMAIAVVALVGLSVSGLAINQILPDYFREQTIERMVTSTRSTALLLQQYVAEAPRNSRVAAEIRDTQVVPRVARDAARFFNATVEIFDSSGRRLERAEPPESAELEEQGLRRDTEVPEFRLEGVLVELDLGLAARYDVILRDPYTTRAETLTQIQSAIIGAGLLALGVSLFTGIIAARRVTRPIARLRRVAGHVAQGQLDERAVPSGVLEVDELGQQFNVMADRLAGTLRMLEADRDRLREFVADVSHELRTPIAALRMYTELLREGDVDEATRAEFLERSAQQIGRLEWLSTNLLDLSRIDAGIFPLDMREGDLRDPVQATVQALSEVAVARGVSLDSEVPGEAVELRFDRERIIQLLTNLVGNALKFTPRGGAVSVGVGESGELVTIEVSDTGPGIPAEELPHVFERFYRGTNTGEARASGSGLGLAIVRSIVEMHGGEIEVASVVGEGTEFRITLPRAHEGEDADRAKVNETSPPAHALTNPVP